ncbi:MAG: hypothetical protein ABI946_00795 [Chthoniobacterales bacterium]
MKDPQENKLSMYRTVQTVLKNNTAEVATIVALDLQVTNLNSSIALIDSLAQAQASETSGVTIDKANVSDEMVDMTMRVAGALKAFASVGNDETLLKKASLTKSDLVKARDEMRPTMAQEIHDLANTNIAALSDYGITAATLTALQTRIDAYKLVAAGPQVAKAEKSTATDLLDQEFARADTILNERIDGLIKQLQGSGTTLYDDYTNARKIINTGAQAKPTPPPTP